jgi:predicted MFS family arabinose efflux permease
MRGLSFSPVLESSHGIGAPTLGAFLDRNGARAVLLLAVLLTGAAALFLSFTHSLAFFFAFYCIARARASAPAPGWRTHRHVGDDELAEADATANAGPIV